MKTRDDLVKEKSENLHLVGKWVIAKANGARYLISCIAIRQASYSIQYFSNVPDYFEPTMENDLIAVLIFNGDFNSDAMTVPVSELEGQFNFER